MIERITKITCDRCSTVIDRHSNWGNCIECGDDLCEKCSGGFDDWGYCKSCEEKAKKCKVICGHLKEILEANDAYYVVCTDGAGDVCQTCFAKEKSIHCIGSGEPEDENEAIQESGESSYWFGGTMAELETLLK